MKSEATNESESHYEEISTEKPEDTLVDKNNTNLVDTSLDTCSANIDVDLVNTKDVSSKDLPLQTNANNLVDTSLDTCSAKIDVDLVDTKDLPFQTNANNLVDTSLDITGNNATSLVDTKSNSTSLVDTSKDTVTSVPVDNNQEEENDTKHNFEDTCKDSRDTPQKNDTVALVDSAGPDTNTNVLSSKDIFSLKTETNVFKEDTASTNELVGTHENLEDKSQGQGTSPPLVDVSSSFVDTSPALVDTSLADISTTSPAEMDMQETLVTEEPVKQPIELEGTQNVKTSAISKVLEPSSTRSSPERRHFLTGPIYPPTL